MPKLILIIITFLILIILDVVMPSVTTKPTKQSEEKIVTVDEKSTRPERPSKFSRKKNAEGAQSNDLNTFIIPKTEEEFCQQLLVGGYVQSYVDFYHLTHRVDPNAGTYQLIHFLN